MFVRISKTRAQKLQIATAVGLLAAFTACSILMVEVGLPRVAVVVLWLFAAPAMILAVRQFSRIDVCPGCGVMLDAVRDALKSQGRDARYCPACGQPLGANNSLKADGPDGPRL
jgi:hypothetical protein